MKNGKTTNGSVNGTLKRKVLKVKLNDNRRIVFAPTDRDRRLVSMMSTTGVPHHDIAYIVGCNPATLEKYFGPELHAARHEKNTRVAKNLYRTAISTERLFAAQDRYAALIQSGTKVSAKVLAKALQDLELAITLVDRPSAIKAQIYWLNCRAGWHTAENDIPIQSHPAANAPNWDRLSADELKLLKELLLKATPKVVEAGV